jgi:Leucine-rich repeat (LRR) protein
MSIALHYSFRKINYDILCEDHSISENSVEQVYLKACDLFKFPEWLFRLENLTHLVISSNLLQQIPKDIERLKNLNYLDISENQLLELPESLFNLAEMKYLDASANYIESLPKGLNY